MNSRTEYRYDDKTGVYIGEQTNTLTYRDKDFYPLPWCVLDKPEPPTGKIAVINSDKTAWEYKADVSGMWYDTATGAEIMLTSADYERDTSALTRDKPGEHQKWNGSAWVDDLDALRAAGLSEISAAYIAERTTANKGVTSTALGGAVIDCRESDVLNIQNLITLLEAQGATAHFYKIKDNSDINCSVSQIKTVLTELIAALLSMWQLKQALTEQVNAATTAEEIQAIKWEWAQE